MTTATAPQNTCWQEIVAIWKDNRWLFALSGWLLGMVTMAAWQRVNVDTLALLHNLVPEAVGIVFTVLILERFAENRAVQERKLALFRQLKSRSNDLAVDALDQILHEGWWDEMREHLKTDRGRINLGAVRWGNGVNLRGAELQHADLGRADLQDANLWEANLQHANLERTNLHRVLLRGANLQETNLREANLEQAEMYGANLKQANLAFTNFKNANLRVANLQQANLYNAYLQQANLVGVFLQQANLLAANLQQANLYRANLQQASLYNAYLQQADLRYANLRDANLEDAKFDEKTVLPDAQPIGKDNEGNPIYDKYWTPDTDMQRYTDPDHPEFWEPEWAKQAREDKQGD